MHVITRGNIHRVVFISRKEGRKEGKNKENQKGKRKREGWGESPFAKKCPFFASRLSRVYEIRIESASRVERCKSYIV